VQVGSINGICHQDVWNATGIDLLLTEPVDDGQDLAWIVESIAETYFNDLAEPDTDER
jgi:hypothetical protein